MTMPCSTDFDTAGRRYRNRARERHRQDAEPEQDRQLHCARIAADRSGGGLWDLQEEVQDREPLRRGQELPVGRQDAYGRR